MKPMFSRRAFLGASAASVGALATGGCTSDIVAYHVAVAEQSQPLPMQADVRDLVRYATLAANGHNAQPWRFQERDRGIDILPDFSRRTPAVDPDDHHLYASLGCSAENLALAARARGMSGEVLFDRTDSGHGHVDLRAAPTQESDLLAAIPSRQCSRSTYDGRHVSSEVVDQLVEAANSHGVDAIFITDDRTSEDILSLVLEGNTHQIDDPAFVAELVEWVRFNPDAAVASGDGLYSASSGNPMLPNWLGPIMFDMLFSARSENDKYAEQVRSSAGIVVFVAATNDPSGWFNAGRAYQRFALQATLAGLKNAFINQAVEVAEVRQDLQSLLGIGGRRPNLIARFGYGPTMPRSLRRPVDAVLA